MTWKDSAAPLREKNFRWYFASRFVNTLGNMMAGVALAFAVLDITDSATALGWVLAAHTIPMVLFLLWGGVIADRLPRALVLQVSNVASGVTQATIALLVITGTAEIWMIVVLSVVHGLVSAMSFPAMASLLPQLVPRDQLQPANALMSLMRGGLTILGPTVSALLVVTVGAGWGLFVDALTWFASAALLLGVRIPPPEASGTTGMLADLREGWDFFRSVTWLWVVVLAFGFLNAIQVGALFTLGPAVAKETIGEQGWGLVLSAESAGLLLMTIVMLRVPLQRPLLLGMLGIATARVADDPVGRASRAGAADGRDVHRGRRHRGLLDGLEPRHAGEHRGLDALPRLLLRRARARSSRCRSASWPTGRSARRSATRTCWSSPGSRTSPSA